MDTKENSDELNQEKTRARSLDKNHPSLSSLIIWNISKALEHNPKINLQIQDIQMSQRCLVGVFRVLEIQENGRECRAASLKSYNDWICNNPACIQVNLLLPYAGYKHLQHEEMSAMRSAYERLERGSRDVNMMISQSPEERHVACAVLAWQQLGHKNTDSLYEFIESRQNKASVTSSENSSKKVNICSVNSSEVPKRPIGFIDHKPSTYGKGAQSGSFDTSPLIGPVLKIPVDTKVVMRVANTSPCTRHSPKKSPKITKSEKSDTTDKIDAACCMDSACAERLKELESSISELRSRASKLARREAERVELLERAEAAWRDLELGYQRRLQLAEEKEDDLAKQIKKSIEDRNSYKQVCITLAQQLSKRGEIVEADRVRLTQVEKEVCDLACTRLRLSEESAKGEAAVADQQCKVVQLERDLQFKEEQARRKLLNIESVADSTRGLILEAERAMREELGTIREQIAQISKQLLDQDEENNQIKTELNELRQQKTEMFEDIEGCKQMCDNRMQGLVDELNKKRRALKELKDKVIECRCKLPLDASVEVKRTPSLAAMCTCTAEEKILHSCSCTSVRSTLLSNLLADMFGGLQAELGDTGSLMPCQLLKCLEDRHNWDRASVVKSNLRSFFSQLLVGELDTAIATSIEKYHATWVGVSCADKARLIPEPGELESEGWQERALENRAHKLASQLAEQLFQERADQLVQRAKDIVTAGPPPCECKPQSNKATAYPCLIKTPTVGNSNRRSDGTYPTFLKRTLQDVTLLRAQIEDLKKESIKKEDLRNMEEKITKIVKQASNPDEISPGADTLNIENSTLNQKAINRSMNTDEIKEKCGTASKCSKKNISKVGVTKKHKKSTDLNGRTIDGHVTGKSIRKLGQSYAVNLCLCNGKNKTHGGLQNSACLDDVNSWKEKLSHGILSKISSMKHSTKDIQNLNIKKKAFKTLCPHDCKCFHKAPSNTSINKLLDTLLKWKGDLLDYSPHNTMNLCAPIGVESEINEIHHNSELSNDKKSVNISQNEEQIKHDSIISASESDHVPPITTSEYIGAINLDKSNDHEISNTNLLKRSLNTNKYGCNKSVQYNKEKNNTTKLNKNIHEVLDKRSILKTLSDTIECSNNKNSIIVNNLQNDESIKCKLYLCNKINQTSERSFIPSDKDFLVKFLGVTLTDINKCETNAISKQTKNEDSPGKTTVFKKQKPSDFNCTITSSSKDDTTLYKEMQCSQTKSFDETNYRCKTSHCKFFETHDDLNMPAIDCYDNNDFTKDTRLGKETFDTQSCVCCSKEDETKNLEVNTLYLLEKHLKHKMAELKKSSCCILPHEEAKVYSSILEKVKQMISDYTYNVKCDCTVVSSNSGSWNRVNSMLHEYLKMKIKRVQCSCIANEDNVDSVLPFIVKKVTDLIESDFERLKSLCNLKNKGNVISEKMLHDNNYIKTGDKCPQNISIQGSFHVGIVNKSCDAFEMKDTKDMQTSQSHSSLLLKSNEVIITHCYNLCDEISLNPHAMNDSAVLTSENIYDEPVNTIGPNLNASLENKELSTHFSLPVPYVGYTLSCSCDNNLGSCICTKSYSQSNIKNIDKIRKMLEINQNLLPNLSYIMHSIPKKVRSENIINFVEVAEASYAPVILENLSTHNAKNVSARDDEEMILKKSDDKIQQIDINDNMTNTIDDLISVTTECLNEDDALFWYDCYPNNHNTKDNTIHKKSFYESVYSPIDKLVKRGKSDVSVKNNVTMCVSRSKNCDCLMVPVCHVKKLVENIESKLVNCQCTCDSFSSQVCPLHSKSRHK